MSGKMKEVRKQMKNIVQDHVRAIMDQEYSLAIEKKVVEHVEQGFKEIQQYVGHIVGQIAYNVENQVHNANLTLQAWEEVILEHTGTTPENLSKLMNEKRIVLAKKLEDEAKAKLEAKEKEEAEKAAAVEPKAE